MLKYIQHFLGKVRHKLVYLSCEYMDLKYVAGHLLYSPALHKHTRVADLGTNKGYFAYTLKNQYAINPYCTEPNPALYEALKKDFNHLMPYAIAGKRGKLRFVLSNNDEAGSLLEPLASVWGTQQVIEVDAITWKAFKQTCGNKAFDVIKMDIEGAEIDVLNSMDDDELLETPQISVEFHEFLDASLLEPSVAVMKRLESLGFKICIYSLHKFSDVLFIHPKYVKWSFLQHAWYWLHRQLSHKGK